MDMAADGTLRCLVSLEKVLYTHIDRMICIELDLLKEDFAKMI